MILQAFFALLTAVMMLGAGTLRAQQLPFEIARVQKDYPVTLFTTESCQEACEGARAALNRRGVPFTEIVVSDEESAAKLRAASGTDKLPTLVVGRAVQIGFEQGLFDAALDTAGYPAAGIYPARNQAAPAPADAQAKPAAPKPAAGPKPGPYDTSGLQGPAPKPGPYDSSTLQGPAPKPGPYGIPGEKK